MRKGCLYFFELYGLVKRHNPDLTFHASSNNDYRCAGLYHKGQFIMSVPLNELPEHTVYAKDGQIKDRGWRTTLGMLLKSGFIKPTKEVESILGKDDLLSWIKTGKGIYYKKHDLVATHL